VQQVQSAGVVIHPSAVQVYKKGARVEDYYCLEPRIVVLTEKRWMKRFYLKCGHCGRWRRNKEIPFKEFLAAGRDVPYDESKWPRGEGTVYSSDCGAILFSEAFVNACSGFSELAFEREGHWS